MIIPRSALSPVPYQALETVCSNHYHYAHFQEWYDQFIHTPGKTADFIRRCEIYMNDRAKAAGQEKYMAVWDQLTMAIAIDDAVAMETEDVYVCVELHGGVTRGQCVVDWRKKMNKAANVRIPTKINMKLFEKLLYDGIAYNG